MCVLYLQDDLILVSSPPTFVSVWGSVHLLEHGGWGWGGVGGGEGVSEKGGKAT